MSVVALGPYAFPVKDALDKFHGSLLLYINWEDHLMFCAPFALCLSPTVLFRDIQRVTIPGLFGRHPDFAGIDWNKAEWFKSGRPWKPELDKTVAGNGLKHKDVIRFRTPGLTGIKGSCS